MPNTLNRCSLLGGVSLTVPQDTTMQAVERFSSVLGCNILYVNNLQNNRADGPGVILEFRDTGDTLTFPTARAAATEMKRMAYMKLYGVNAPQRMAVDDMVAQRAVAQGLVNEWRQSYPEIKQFADEVMHLVKEAEAAKAKEQSALAPKELPRRLINLADD